MRGFATADTVASECRLQALLTMLVQARQRPVPSHEAGLADNVGGDDCRQFVRLTGT